MMGRAATKCIRIRITGAMALGLVGAFASPVWAQQTPSWAPSGWTPPVWSDAGATSPDGGTTEPWYQTQAAALVAKMTDDEKIQQLNYHPPAISQLGIPSYALDTEVLHGVRSFAGANTTGFTVFPDSIGLGATWDPALLESIGSAIGDEARGSNVKSGTGLVVWGPVINLDRNPLWGRFDEAFGEDVYHTGQLGAAMVLGLQGTTDPKYLKTASTLKHYSAYSAENGRGGNQITMDERNYREYYTNQFRAVVTQSHPVGNMVAYNAINGVPNAASSLLLTTLLRQQWGFNGYVVGDCGAVGNVASALHYGSSAVVSSSVALLAGTDSDCSYGGGFTDELGQAESMGYIQSTDLDRAVTRDLMPRFLTGELGSPTDVSYSSIAASAIHSMANQTLALQAAHESITLLKNSGILPLSMNSLKSIALIGPHANDAFMGDYSGNAANPVSALEGLQLMFSSGTPTVNYQKGCNVNDNDQSGISAAVQAAMSSDVAIVVLGTDESVMQEGQDRSNWNLPGVQLQLLQAVAAANPKTILVLVTQGNLAVDWAQSSANVPAILSTWCNGEKQGTALADVLFGVYNPAGRLTTTWYTSNATIPDESDYNLQDMPGRTYMYYTGTPLYPFGYGLSYTKFTYANLSVAPATVGPSCQTLVSFDVTNSGMVDGDEVAQVYVHDNASTASYKPAKQLRAFKRVTIKAGQKTTIQLPINAQDMALWNTTSESWVVTPGMYQVFVGGSSANTPLMGSFTIGDMDAGCAAVSPSSSSGSGASGSSSGTSGSSGSNGTTGAGGSSGVSGSSGTGTSGTGTGGSSNGGTGSTGGSGGGGGCACVTAGSTSSRPGVLLLLSGLLAAFAVRRRGVR